MAFRLSPTRLSRCRALWVHPCRPERQDFIPFYSQKVCPLRTGMRSPPKRGSLPAGLSEGSEMSPPEAGGPKHDVRVLMRDRRAETQRQRRSPRSRSPALSLSAEARCESTLRNHRDLGRETPPAGLSGWVTRSSGDPDGVLRGPLRYPFSPMKKTPPGGTERRRDQSRGVKNAAGEPRGGVAL